MIAFSSADTSFRGRLGQTTAVPEAAQCSTMGTKHISGDSLEQYALGQLREPDLAIVEEHLLVCEHCRARLADVDAFIRAMRDAARE